MALQKEGLFLFQTDAGRCKTGREETRRMAEKGDSSDKQTEDTARSETWTIGRLVQWVTEDFRSKGIESPKLEAELLLSFALGVARIQIIVDRDRPLSSSELSSYRSLVTRRRKREPLAYLTGEKEFYGRSYFVDQRVLIPRPDTETLVEVALERTKEDSLFGRALDLCTGSGIVPISFGLERPTWHVAGSDISADALNVAKLNAIRLGATWNLRFYLADLFPKTKFCARLDLLTANPPYIRSAEMEGLEPEIRLHEPQLALEGGADGLDLVRKIAKAAPRHMNAGAVIAMEVGFDQTEETANILESERFTDIRINKDLGGRPRVVSAIRGESRSESGTD
jgi:release factor glutamine methyltransferase